MKLGKDKKKIINPDTQRNISLIPHSGIQFLDYQVDFSQAGKFGLRFHNCRKEAADGNDSKVEYFVHPVEPDSDISDPYNDDITYASIFRDGPGQINKEETYEIRAKQCFELFDRQWLPIPYFRINSEGKFEKGPTNWARI